jgi:hypothetical protein
MKTSDNILLRILKLKWLLLIFFGLVLISGRAFCQVQIKDTIGTYQKNKEKYDLFYQNLKLKAEKKKFTKWLHNLIIHKPKDASGLETTQALSYLTPYKDKTISEINIKALDVFGPNLSDTTLKAHSKIQIWANKVHTKTNLNIIRKNLLFKSGDKLNPEILYDNERIIRELGFIKDVKILVNPDSVNSESVKVTVLTKDVFSFGVSGRANGLSSASFAVYNQNIFGAGHEFSIGLSGKINEKPFPGFETYYSIPNIKGKFINFNIGFLNTYKQEGLNIGLNREFLTPTTKWAGGIWVYRLSRSDRIASFDPVSIDDSPLDFFLWQAWGGRTFQFNEGKINNSQFTVSTNIMHQIFYNRPLPDENNRQYFSNSTFYLAGLTWSKRIYLRDQLIYAYGITEDIPKGFKHEMVVGYNANEFGDRYYAHLIISNGNLLPRRPGYLYLSGSIGGYFNEMKFEQGMIQFNANFISKLFTAGEKRYRFFIRLNYLEGIRRFDLENLMLRGGNHIRGFTSSIPQGKQRLSLNIETVFFRRKEIYNFSIAFFVFSDLGIIGSGDKFVLKENYYAGIGAGVRMHNESLVLKTIQLRLAFYPNHPSNMSPVGFIVEEQLRKRFYSFQPEAPQSLRFE